MASKSSESVGAEAEGATRVHAGGGVVNVEGASTGLVLALLAPLIVTARSSGFQQFFLI